MNSFARLCLATLLLAANAQVAAQDGNSDTEQLKIAALEALVSAPPERALPLAAKVLAGDNSDQVKSRALFVLSQIDDAEAQDLLLRTARDGSGEVRYEAVRMIGIGGHKPAMQELRGLYAGADEDMREAVMEAYLIADDKQSVFEIAANASTADEFDTAVRTLGAMDAREELRQLRGSANVGESLIEALAISGDAQTLRELAMDDSNPQQQARAIEALGIVDDENTGPVLMEIYRGSGSDTAREAALQGMLIADYDDGVLELYRASKDAAEKKELLEMLVIMDSDEVWNLVDAALDGAQ
jgi:HEAT repeat protein